MKVFDLDTGNTIVVGNNAKENFEIIDTYDKSSLWFHVHDLPSCHVLLVGKDFSREEINEAASRCKMHSKYKNFKVITVEYLELKYVRKTTTLGMVTLDKTPTLIKI